jgi:hypothetical protein
VALACPINGVSIGDWENRATWRIDFKPEATSKQRQAAQKALLAFNPEDTHPEHVGPPRVIR